MNTKHLILVSLTAALVTIAPNPVDAGGSFGIHISNHGVGVGFGGANWGIWGSSWNTGQVSVGFSASLDGYGEWVSIDGLGRAWRPWVAAGWQPYSHGRWVWTSLGWTWVAYEPWGWVPHHYGNWAFTTVGWVWTPGYTYHPGNVVWVSSGSYYGWVPCAPRGWSHFHRGYHQAWNDGYRWGHHDGYRQGYEDGWRDARYATWVPRHHVTSDNVSHHVVRHDAVTRSVARSRITPMAAPPSKTQVERVVGRSVPESRVVERTATIDGRRVRVVRPEGQTDTVRRHGAETVKSALAPSVRERAGVDRISRERSTTPTRKTLAPSSGTTDERVERGQRTATTTTQRHRTVTTTSRRPNEVVSTRGTRGVEQSRSRSSASRPSAPKATVSTATRQRAQRTPQATTSSVSSRTVPPTNSKARSTTTRTSTSSRSSTKVMVEGSRDRSRASTSSAERTEPAKRRHQKRD